MRFVSLSSALSPLYLSPNGSVRGIFRCLVFESDLSPFFPSLTFSFGLLFEVSESEIISPKLPDQSRRKL